MGESKLNDSDESALGLGECNGELSDSREIGEMIRKATRGDPQAARQLVEIYGPQIQLEARMRLIDTGLGRYLDSVDVTQSVFRLFFERDRDTAADKAVEDPRYLRELLNSMVRRQVVDFWRRQTAEKRDVRKTEYLEESVQRLPTAEAPPDEVAALRDWQEAMLSQFSPMDHYVAQKRLAGTSWREIARELRRSPQALRRQLERAARKAMGEMKTDGLSSTN